MSFNFKLFKGTGPQTPDEYAEACAELKAGISNAETQISSLNEERASAILTGDEDKLHKVSADLLTLENEKAALEKALPIAEERQSAAVEAEANLHLERRADEARKCEKALLQTYINIDETAEKLAGLISEANRMRREIQQHNAVVCDAKRGDLQAALPMTHHFRQTGRHIPDPVAGFKLPRYFPPEPDGTPLRQLKDSLTSTGKANAKAAGPQGINT